MITEMNKSGHEPQEGQHRPSKRRHIWLAVVLIVVALVVYGVFFGKRPPATKQQAAAGQRPTPVAVVPARTADVGVYLSGLGSVVPLNTVTVKTRVDGQLMQVLFREGQVVGKGSVLAQIDPRPFDAQLSQAEGQMARDQALLRNARIDLERFQLLARQDSISRQQLDTQEALVRQLEGSIQADKGLVDSARLQRAYSRITAPIAGRTGLRLVDQGNIVHASDANGLVVITQVQPINVVFAIAEDNLQPVLDKLRSGSRLAVEAYNREGTMVIARGALQTIDNVIDPTTGTVKLKAIFDNKGNELFPNQFVNARLLVDTKLNAVVVPASAVQHGAQGTFVYLLKADQTVTIRPVTTGPPQGNDISIANGLAPGEQVVVEGTERLREGSKVEVRGANDRKGPADKDARQGRRGNPGGPR